MGYFDDVAPQVEQSANPPATRTEGAPSAYASRALNDELATLLSTPEGRRNDQLNIAAFNLGQLVAAGELDRVDVEQRLIAAARGIGLEAGEIAKTIASGLDDGEREPRVIPQLARLASQVREVDASELDPGSLFVHLPTLLDEPDEEIRYRVDRLLPVDARAVLAAQYKAGKTTMRDNLVRSIADGSPFLDEFAIQALEDGRTIAVVDNEMNRSQIRRWLRDQGVRHPERVWVVPLRGRAARFNLLDAPTRAYWAEELRAHHVGFVVFDCLRPVLDACGLDESHDAGRFLVAFDATLEDARVTESVVVHHMGHNGERSRGDSRIRDWPDVEWRLVREQPANPFAEADPSAARYFSAYGRDVDVSEGLLSYDGDDRHLSWVGGSRGVVKANGTLAAVLDVLEGGPMSGNAIEKALVGTGAGGAKKIRAAIKQGVDLGSIEHDTTRNLYSLRPLRPASSDEADDGSFVRPIDERTSDERADEDPRDEPWYDR